MRITGKNLTIIVDGAVGHFPEQFVKTAIEKQLSKKPVENGKYKFECPCCKSDLGIEKEDIYVYGVPAPSHCEDCGQALDWSDIK